MRTLLRVLVGFVIACLAAALTTVLFVHTPEEVVGWLTDLPADERGERLSVFGLLWLAAATQSALFALVFALVAIVVAEWRKVRAWTYYAIIGIVIALVGFAAQWLSEPSGQNWSVLNSHYPFVAFLTTGFVGGLVYWMAAGRHAGGVRPAQPAPETPKPVASAKPEEAAKPADEKGKAAAETPKASAEAAKPASETAAAGAESEAASKA